MAACKAVAALWAFCTLEMSSVAGRSRPYSRSWLTSVTPFTVLTVRITPCDRPSAPRTFACGWLLGNPPPAWLGSSSI